MNLGHISARRGFTLIELLVVIAIIGILSSVVLASLNTARNKGADASIKSNLANARAEAEIYYDEAGNYTDVCLSTATNNVFDSATAAKNTLGTAVSVSRDAAASATVVACNDTAAGWAIQAPLKSPSTTTYYCVDSTGASKESTTNMVTTTSDIAC